jgi:UDP-galactopyranose mutase
MQKKILCVGAGFSGSIIARELADKINAQVDVIDIRDHIGGNCYTEVDKKTGITVHKYGPHIFHTNNIDTWNYINRFSEFKNFSLRVKAKTYKGIYSLPINLLTINQFFGKTFFPKDAEEFIKSQAVSGIQEPANFEEQALKFIGKELYEAFFYGYTKKQWGVEPKLLPASILKRLPVRFNYDDNYYYDLYSGMPSNGYTQIFENLLDHPNISIQLNTSFEKSMIKYYDHIFYSGKLDDFYNYKFGELSYRTVYWENQYDKGDFVGNCVLNFCEENIPYTRIIEHKYFENWKNFEDTIISKEFSREAVRDELPFYPKRLPDDLKKLEKYQHVAYKEDKVTFVGRLGTYRYLDMNVVIEEAIEIAKRYCEGI